MHWPIVAAAIIACFPMAYVALRGRKPPVPKTAQLTHHLRDAIAQVQHQIDLLGSVARWYLAPLAISGTIFLLDGLLTAPVPTGERKLMIIPFLIGVIVIGAVFYAVWKLNQFAVRKQLEPRLRRLQETLAEIER